MPTCLSLQFPHLQGDFNKMQGEPTQILAGSHCVVGSWKDFSLSKEQGEASWIAGRAGLPRDGTQPGTAGASRREPVRRPRGRLDQVPASSDTKARTFGPYGAQGLSP